MTTFAVAGAGWRAAAYWRLAARLGGLACVGVVARSPRRLPVPLFPTLDACLAAARPDFLVTALPRTVNPGVVGQAVARGLPVLSETPPAAGLAELRALWAATGESGLVQVAEQYLLMPSHAARAAAVHAGLIGTPGQVQISSTQLYHAVSLMRGLLGAGRGPVTVRASRHRAPLADPLARGGWTDDPVPRPATTTVAMLDFGGGRSGLYDFTDRQTRNQLRFRRILVRGSHGELRDDEVVRLAAPRTIVRAPLVRHGWPTRHITLDGRVLFRNPYAERLNDDDPYAERLNDDDPYAERLNDDEVATATILEATAAWVRGAGPPPYPLADGVHDHQVGLAIEEAADTGRTVTTSAEPWTPVDT